MRQWIIFTDLGTQLFCFIEKINCLYMWTIKIVWLPTILLSLLGMQLNERTGSSQPSLVRIIPLS